jgi:SAM-dependent methyltransferase
VAGNPAWYHTIALPDGTVTPGFVDWRAHARRVLPPRLDGVRALDVGTYDGFWSFAMEERGAAVTAIDLERLDAAAWPPVHRARLARQAQEWGLELGRGFRIAAAARDSAVQRVVCDVMELAPERVGGTFALVFMGALLLHLRDPVRALENIRGVLEPGGRLLLLETVSLRETLLRPRAPVARFDTAHNDMNWWLPNVRTLHTWLWAAGFTGTRRIGRGLLRPPARPEMRCWYCAIEATV